ncbi:ROK family transcriptional regulator [Cohnella zeiphila]|uniref:ROK family transcriptional regulator n=1 Tax=Cohnella zeiphila TaxID=2761120 RepID=A0A7X0SQK1_9BACL|nr:ROK family transcriptional regulator [Cohnella zeiphila]MBB6734307.1 ROK family transcriptional regulator [Cohnella zeiphila]
MAGTRGRGPTLSKDMNRKLIYRTLKGQRTSTRTELAAALGLNKNTVNAIVEELMSAGYVRAIGLQDGGGGAGRRALGIAFEPAKRQAFGFQLANRSLIAVVTDLYGAPLEQAELPVAETEPQDVVDAMAGFVRERLAIAPDGTFVGLGLGVPAVVDPAGERVVQSTHLGWTNVPLKALLAEALPLGITLLDNAVKLASQGELWYGAGQGLKNFAYCSFGAGVGCSLVIDGEIVRGEAGFAGELGHIAVEPGGPPCSCGNAGCLEAVAGLTAICARLEAATGKPFDAGRLAASVREGHPAVRAEMERAGRAIGTALAGLVNLMNPRRIILDGPLMLASDSLLTVIAEEMCGKTLPFAFAQTEIVRSSLQPLSAAIGAAAGVVRDWERQEDPLGAIVF